MTDVSDGSGPISRRTPRANDGGAPVGGALAIMLAFLAVVAGFLILRSISGDSEDNAFDVRPTGDATDEQATGDDGSSASLPASTLSPVPVATTQPPIVTQGATVIVANANEQGGSASQMSRALEAGPGFTMGSPTDAAGLAEPLVTSIVYYDPAQAGAQAVADSVARALGGGVTVLPLPAGSPPTASGSLDGAGVLLMLGLDKAGKTLEELNPGSASTPVQVTNPPVGATTAPPGTTAAGG